MIATTHPVAQEDVMALLDGELSTNEAKTVSTHLDQCDECAELAGQLRRTSQLLSAWIAPAVPSRLDEALHQSASKFMSNHRSAKPESFTRWNWRSWTLGSATAALAAMILIASVSIFYRRHAVEESRMAELRDQPQAAPYASQKSSIVGGAGAPEGAGIAAMNAYSEADSLQATPTPAPAPPPPPSPQQPPMIARSASLTIQVSNFASARRALDAVLARHHGYAAQLTVNTPENEARSLQASLRIPAPELAAALAEIRTLGRVEVETQSGEEVTQQHADLVARLENARETEQRLRGLLAQRTGKIDEVLQVEEAIDRVRGEIENMEADQKTLEHRVDFASVDLQLTEEYKEKFNPQPASVSGSMQNAFVAGLRHATGALLGIVLFLEEFGPVLLIWVAILGIPSFLAWRRYRRARARF